MLTVGDFNYISMYAQGEELMEEGEHPQGAPLQRRIRGIWGVFGCEVEDLGEVLFEGVADLVSGDGGVQDFLDGGHGGVGDAAVIYEGEVAEIGGEVKREAVHGDPALHVDADGGDLVFADPDAGFIPLA